MSNVDESQETLGHKSEAAALLEQQRNAKKVMKQHQRETQLHKIKEQQEKPDKQVDADAETARDSDKENCEDADEGVLAEQLEESLHDIKIATIGNVDAGKSTLVGVLTKAMLDDGRGKARSLVFNSGVNGHESQNGRTSSIAKEIMGWRKDGEQILEERAGATVAARNATWTKIATTSEKAVTFIDLCGHEGYLKTTIFGLIGLCPDYAMIVVNANAGFQKMTREHLGIALALKIPIFLVVTKIDIAPDNVFEENMQFLTKMLKSKAVGRVPLLVKSEEDIASVTQPHAIESVCPIFCISSVTGVGLPMLRLFLRKVPSRTFTSGLFKPVSDPAELHIDQIFNVPGVGIVVSGLLRAGQVVPNQQLLLGPDKTGAFNPCRVKTIHYRRLQVDRVESGQAVCFAVTSLVKKEQLKKSSFRKGMVMVDPMLKPRATWIFKVEVVILHHATTIQQGYEPVIHCGIIRQSAKITDMSQELLRNGDKAIVTFCFRCHAEYLTTGSVILFREGRTKGFGRIMELSEEKPDISFFNTKNNSRPPQL